MSTGAIVSSLLAVDYSAAEIKNELEQLNYNNFKDEGLLDKLDFFGKSLSIGFEYGIYEGESFENSLEKLLVAEGKTTFGDITTDYKEERYKYKFQAIAADITDRLLLILPNDLKLFGINPDEFSISRAVRMSMGIPFFFEPVELPDISGRKHFIVDSGLLSNYPIWLLDDNKTDPPWPPFEFKLMEPDKRELKEAKRKPINNPISFLKAIVSTMLNAHENYHISKSKGDFDRTICIPTVIKINSMDKEIGTTDFNITQEESQAPYENGVKVAQQFLKKWDFEKWKKKYRWK